MSGKIKLTLILILISFSLLVNAQEKKDPVSKLMKLKGEIENITIKTDKEIITLKGADAKKLLGKLKKVHKHNNKKIVWISNESDNEFIEELEIEVDGDRHISKQLKAKGHIFKTCDDKEDLKIFISRDHDKNAEVIIMDKDGDELVREKIKIEVNDDDDEITVKETITKDGKKEVKTYKGKEAKEFLKKRKIDKGHIVIERLSDCDDEVIELKVLKKKKIEKSKK
ncbi:MAG: hypothetical protein ACEPO8_01275 [Rhodothermaceae bacterium]